LLCNKDRLRRGGDAPSPEMGGNFDCDEASQPLFRHFSIEQEGIKTASPTAFADSFQ
jgi:hypothetical protein